MGLLEIKPNCLSSSERILKIG